MEFALTKQFMPNKPFSPSAGTAVCVQSLRQEWTISGSRFTSGLPLQGTQIGNPNATFKRCSYVHNMEFSSRELLAQHSSMTISELLQSCLSLH